MRSRRRCSWHLATFGEGDVAPRRINVHPFPFRVGRLPENNLVLARDSISKEHAEFVLEDEQLRVSDLGSKNGTFVNGERVVQSRLRVGDTLHFADVEFHIGRQTDVPLQGLPRSGIFWRGHLVGHLLGDPFEGTIDLSCQVSQAAGLFTPLDCPASREFMRLLQSHQGGLGEDTPGGWVSYSYDEQEGWLRVSSARRRSKPREEAANQERLRETAGDTLRQDVLDAVADGESDCAYALARELVSFVVSRLVSHVHQWRVLLMVRQGPESLFFKERCEWCGELRGWPLSRFGLVLGFALLALIGLLAPGFCQPQS